MSNKLTPSEIQERLATLPGWEVVDDQLQRTFQLPSFAHAAMWIGAIGHLAEAAGHHPDLLLHGYNKVTVMLTTHSANGLTVKDFDLAEQINNLPQRKPKA